VQADRKVVLDFGPAWAAAYGKAKAKVRLHFFFQNTIQHLRVPANVFYCLIEV
jgi:hypothetical protein